MSKTMVILIMAVLATLSLSGRAEAQKIEVKSMQTVPGSKEGFVSLEWGSGEAVSKQGSKVKFELSVDSKGIPSGYKFEERAAKSLKAGEQIPLFIRNLKVKSSGFDAATDESGARLMGTISYPPFEGAWKVVIIESVSQSGDEVLINVREELKLADGRAIKELRFLSKEGYLLNAPAPEVAKSEKADQAQGDSTDAAALPAKPAIPLWGWIAGGGALIALILIITLRIRTKSKRKASSAGD